MKHSPSAVLIALLSLITACTYPSVNKESDSVTAPMTLTQFDTIRLVSPDLTKSVSLMTALKNRRSDRDFTKENLSLQQLSEVLWAANGLNRANDTLRTTAPSARALYPVQIYAALKNGIYKYNNRKHLLEPVLEGNYMEATGIQSFVTDAPLNLIYIADLAKHNNLQIASIDAGHNSQNVYLYCAAEGLKVVVRGSVEIPALLNLLRLDTERFQFIMAQTVGK
ncbi:MAG: SagB/ThcOx family dehydrogenase [Bacteroidales bacterium]